MFSIPLPLSKSDEQSKPLDAGAAPGVLQLPVSEIFNRKAEIEHLRNTPPEMPQFVLAPVPKQTKLNGIPETQSLEKVQLYDGDGKKISGKLAKDAEFEMTPHTAAGIINDILATLPKGKNTLRIGIASVADEHRSNIYLRAEPIDLSRPADEIKKIRDVIMIMAHLPNVKVEGDASSAKISFLEGKVLVARHLGKNDD